MAAPVEDGARRIGENVRNARRFRGMSLEVLAGLVGRSKAWLSKIENGHARLERRSDIRALAEALEVSAADLLGEPVPAIRPNSRGLGDVVALREVLLDSSLANPLDVAPRPLDSLADLAHGQVHPLFRAADYARLTTVLPGMLSELHVHASDGEEHNRQAALRLVVDLSSKATAVLRHLGQTDLAWIAADHASSAARVLDDEVVLGMAAFTRAHSRPSAGLSRALREVPAAAERLEPHVGDDRQANEVYGMLHLSAALAYQVQGNHDCAADHVAEAGRVAERFGEHSDAWGHFGPANVGTWRAMLAVEAGEPGEALDAAKAVDVEALPQGRKAALMIESSRALAMAGRDKDAVQALRRAEKLSVARVHKNPMVRELVADLYDNAASRDLRGLAWRMNLV